MKMPRKRAPLTHSRATSVLDRMAPFLSAATARTASAQWSGIQTDYMLDLFKSTARYVPAYRAFLKDRGIIAKTIKTIGDFKKIPPISKKNYLRKYAWEDLCVPGSIDNKPLVLAATSGSTGKPFYFPRSGAIDEQAYVYHRTFLHNSKLDPTEPTLVIVAFGMGVWIGGIITYEAFSKISERDFPLTILTPGVNKKEIYEALRELGKQYTQLILCGYPPFIKDTIDDGPENGINWKQYDMRVVCAAEGFSEEFRDYLIRKTGMRDRYRDIMNIYGSAELGTMATETPISVLVRESSLKHPTLFVKLFSEATRLPTLAQYVPSFVSFEAMDNRIYCTAGNALPMIRYDIGDHGGVLSYADVKRICASEGINLAAEAKRAGISDAISELPFVYIYERADLSTKLYGAIIFPEHVKHGLMNKKFEKLVTGKFTMFTKNDISQDEYLEINIELKKGAAVSGGVKEELATAIQESLCEKSAEHKNNTLAMGERVHPRIVFWDHNHPEHFTHGAKHRWVKKL